MTNSQAIGYMILAAQTLGLDEKQIRQLEQGMKYQMDSKTEETAEKAYQEF